MNITQLQKTGLLLALIILMAGCLWLRKAEPLTKRNIVGIEEESSGKQANTLGPNELFYLDRNYPALAADPDIFREKLKLSIAFDKTVTQSNRGLDAPWTIEGPGNIGGRVNTIAIHPVDPAIILIGYSQGGIYRTEDGGINWTPVFDDQPSLSISHISFDPFDPDKVWATTGDVNISGYPFNGAGVYQSNNGGRNWVYRGLDQTGVLSKVLVDPSNENVVYVGSMGYPSHKGNERGLYRSPDGGNSWQKTLTIDDSTGVIDMVTDPTHAGRVFASVWTRLRSSKIGATKGPGTGLYQSNDYGVTWTNVTNGLPSGEHSRTGVEITRDGTLFISYIGDVTEGECGNYVESLQGIYFSHDSGISWDSIPTSSANGFSCDLFGQFGWYFEVLKVNPDDPLDMVLLGIDLLRTLDGGFSWFEAAPPWWTYDVHADKHDVVFAHGEIYVGTDGGAYKTDINQLNNWVDIENIPSTQFYRTAFNPHLPDQYFGGAQDNGTTGGNASIINDWPRILGGDGFQPRFDPTDPAWMYALTQNGVIYFTEDGGFNWVELTNGLDGTRYWDMPLVMSSQDPKILFCGSDRVYRIDMRDTLREWKEISPDLTRGEFVLGNRYPAITSIAQSDLDEMRLYAGTQDGLLWTTADGGLNWTNITDGTPGFYVTSITCSTVSPIGVFATYSGYRDDDHHPYIYQSGDSGLTWSPVHSDLPMMGVNSLYILPEWDDAVLFAATDGGVYFTEDAGMKWKRIGNNMPYMPVYDLDFNPYQNTLVAATFSRGIMTFPIDDLDLGTAVHDQPNLGAQGIKVYPTISTGTVYIEAEHDALLSQPVNITLLDINGVVLDNKRIRVASKEKLTFTQDLPTGVYFLLIESDQRSYVRQIVFQKSD